MSHTQRNSAIIAKLRSYTEASIVSKKTARAALIREGFLTSNGKTSPEFSPKKDKERA